MASREERAAARRAESDDAEATSDTPQTTDDILRQILAEQQQNRKDVAELRKQINAAKQAPPAPSAAPQTAEDLLAARLEEVSKHEYYCTGCGRLYDYPQRCVGSGDQPHAPIEVVSTDELKGGDPSKHSAPVYTSGQPAAIG